MSKKRQELELRVAASRALAALLEAGRYSRYGLTTAGARVNRRAVAAAAEGVRRSGAAWSALRGRTAAPPRRRATGTVVVLVTGSAAALGIRQGFAAWRAAHPGADPVQSLRGVLRPGPPVAPAPAPPATPAGVDETAPAQAAAPGIQ